MQRPRPLHASAARRSLEQDVCDTLPSLLLEESQLTTPDREPKPADCLSEDEILNFCDGTLAWHELRRVDEHLSQCNSCSCLVADTLGDRAPSSGLHAQFPLAPFVYAPGTRVAGRYVIQRLIGRGGMGEVYEAYDLQRQQAVALKTVLATQCDSRQAMARLKLELSVGRKIHHPNVCRTRETGTHEDAGAPLVRFITMDLVEGETLGQHLRTRGALPAVQARHIARQVLEGLAAAHAAGVLHLDVKSDNVMLRQAPAGLQAVLIDFGLSRSNCGEASSSWRRRPAGTLSYMAPEQLLQQPTGAFTDVFGFGVVAYELLTGRHPAASRSETVLQPRRLRAAELPLHPVRAASGIPFELDRFVAACTCAGPARRYPDAASALEHFDRLWL